MAKSAKLIVIRGGKWSLVSGAFSILAIYWLYSCQQKDTLPDTTMLVPEKISYNFHVKPILSDRCFNCHGPDENKREAELRLDMPESAYAELVNSPGKYAIVPSRVRSSELYHRIVSEDSELQMPPPESKLSLSKFEKAILIKWIEQGAEYQPHWAFQPLQVPTVKGDGHPVDFFVKKKLLEKNLNPAKRSEKASLIRRVYFDLTGLPPKLTEVDEFLADQDVNAFSKIIDTLLQRPAYGERMAADWMDIARYADSDGYLDDKHRNFSPWRDWVIKAFNENMPYDQFVTWQLAGDLIPTPTSESILATAFNRLHRRNSEAGIVFEEYRVEYVADRVNTFSKAFLGLTVECARCHDHKYDPITQKEYYQLFAFFNSTNELGTAVYGPKQTPGPGLLLSSAKQQEVIDFITEKIKHQESSLKDFSQRAFDPPSETTTNRSQVRDIKQSLQKKLVAYHNFDKLDKRDGNKIIIPNYADPAKPATMYQPRLEAGIRGQAFYVEDYNYVLLGKKVGWYDRQDPFSVSVWLRPNEVYTNAGIFTHCEDLRLGYKGYSLHLQNNHLRFIMAYSWPTNAIEIVSDTVLTEKEWAQVAITYDGSSRADGIKMFLNGQPISHQVIADHLYKGILFEPDLHTYGFQGLRLGYRDKIKPFKGGAIDEIKVFNGQLSQIEVLYDYQPQMAGEIEKMPNSGELFQEYYLLNHDPQYAVFLDSLYDLRTALNQEVSQISEVMVMGDLPKPRPTYLLRRGMYDAPDQEVYPDVPKALATNMNDFPKDRHGLSQWLFTKENPLTARVFVNRIWQQHFGRGLVKTAEDFGAQGALPSHPGLLDYLANYFIWSGWDIKALHKLILTSDTYLQSSRADSVALDRDPENIWLSRGPSQRLTAEMTRDNVLALSELLVEKQGGPSVYPYQPAGLWDEISNKSWRYPYLQEAGEGLYRRSLYTIWKRTSPPPSMLLFDVPDRSFCMVQRRETNTPLQALVLLNDPQYIEASREVARNIWTKHADLRQRFEEVFRMVLTRFPTEKEMDLIHDFYRSELAKINRGEINIDDYFSNGEMSLPAVSDRQGIAALAMLTHNLLNTYEAQMKK